MSEISSEKIIADLFLGSGCIAVSHTCLFLSFIVIFRYVLDIVGPSKTVADLFQGNAGVCGGHA